MGYRLLLSLLLSCAGVALVPQRLATARSCPIYVPGQIVSADVWNECIAGIEPDLTKVLTDNNGSSWDSECWDSQTASAVDSPGTGILTVNSLTDITFTNVSNSSDQCVFGTAEASNSASIRFDRFKIVGNHSIITVITILSASPLTTSKTWNVIELEQNSLAMNSGSQSLLKLTRRNAPPTAPTSFSASASGRAVTLTWTDNSSDETSFRIFRKDSLLGTYVEVGSVNANTTTFTETLTGSGTYWYRVFSRNGNGPSTLGSNVSKLTVE